MVLAWHVIHTVLWTTFTLAAPSSEKISMELDKIAEPLKDHKGWEEFIKKNSQLCGQVNTKSNYSHVEVIDQNREIEGQTIRVGLGCRTVFILAKPSTVVTVVDSPQFFQSLYGLDKPAVEREITPSTHEITLPQNKVNADQAVQTPKNNSVPYEARIFKLVPGIETQDYTLKYESHWENLVWIGSAKMTKDAKNFAVRHNVKIIEPFENGSVYREVALFVPIRWWVKLFSGLTQKVTKQELKKLNFSIKCAAEKVEKGEPMSDSIGKLCHKYAEDTL